ncbi:ribose-5-phosphate isomerase RpiA [Loktanella agnita]|uniref:ribose-5-phosphate isomerase RpiA n=1 Tax=Loktanella agnita TaxID=287097 RepID=UPI003988E6BC
MTAHMSAADKAKYFAARQAATYVKSGMKVGLGTGSTAEWLVKCLGEMVRDEGLQIQGVPTSERTGALARQVGIKVITLDAAQRLDITIDGTDEYDPDLCLIKGGGGAHLREKIVAAASDRMVVIADESKTVDTLGAFPLPVEVIPFGMRTTEALIAAALVDLDVAARDITLRMAGDAPYVSDEGNHIFDLHLKRIGDARKLSQALNQIPGVVENGLFIDICKVIVVGHDNGRVTVTDGTDGGVQELQLEMPDTDRLFADLGV